MNRLLPYIVLSYIQFRSVRMGALQVGFRGSEIPAATIPRHRLIICRRNDVRHKQVDIRIHYLWAHNGEHEEKFPRRRRSNWHPRGFRNRIQQIMKTSTKSSILVCVFCMHRLFEIRFVFSSNVNFQCRDPTLWHTCEKAVGKSIPSHIVTSYHSGPSVSYRRDSRFLVLGQERCSILPKWIAWHCVVNA